MHTICPQVAFPFILSADATVVNIGAGMDKLSTAKKRAANVAAISFM
jgi:hypothetical protein